MNKTQRNVCIIGAGAAGLVALRWVNENQFLKGVIFEGSGDLGGVWNYSEGIHSHSSAYNGLKTNLPKQIMGYLDEDFGTTEDDNSFMMHQEVLQFLRNYADKYQLRDNIKFRTNVTSVKPIFADKYKTVAETGRVTSDLFFDNLRWEVTHQNETNDPEIQTFDAVLVCNGHFSKPLIPEIPNLNLFSGQVLHSKDYRIPEPFANKRILVVGCGPSGIDIMLDVLPVAKQVTLSMRNPPYPGKLPGVIHQTSQISKIICKNSEKSSQVAQVEFSNGEIADFDVILLCTGYEYSLPFSDCGLEIQQGKFIFPLFRHMINVNFPTMALIGLNFRVCPFMLFDAQVRNFVKFLQGLISYPSKLEMLKEIDNEMEYRISKNVKFNCSHQLEDLQWPYFQKLGSEADFLHLLKPVTRKIYEKVGQRRKYFPEVYKLDKIIVKNDCDFDIIEHK